MSKHTGTLQAALTLAYEEGMLDGQDPLKVFKRCSEAQLNAPVFIELEVCARGQTALRVERHDRHLTLITAPKQDWPTLLKMYVSLRATPLQQEIGLWPVYAFARRLPTKKDALPHFLKKLSDRHLAHVVIPRRDSPTK